MNNKKNKFKKDEGHRVGRRIRAKKVRVIDQTGNNLGVLWTRDALDRAEEANLDLVEINKGEIPTCKILDYGKMKYQESKKEKKKENKSYEVQFRPKIGEHDLLTKVKHAKKFLEKGSIVHLIVQFRGREAIHPDTGRTILDRATEELKDVSIIVKRPLMQGKKMSMILAPRAD